MWSAFGDNYLTQDIPFHLDLGPENSDWSILLPVQTQPQSILEDVGRKKARAHGRVGSWLVCFYLDCSLSFTWLKTDWLLAYRRMTLNIALSTLVACGSPVAISAIEVYKYDFIQPATVRELK